MSEKSLSIYYQPTCGFCKLCRFFIEKRLGETEIIFFDIVEHAEREGKSASTDSIVVVFEGKEYFKYTACLVIAKQLRKPWPFFASVLRVIPKKIGDWGYDIIANNRDILMKVYRILYT